MADAPAGTGLEARELRCRAVVGAHNPERDQQPRGPSPRKPAKSRSSSLDIRSASRTVRGCFGGLNC